VTSIGTSAECVAPTEPAAELIIGGQEMQDPKPSFGVGVGEPAAVDAAPAEAIRRWQRAWAHGASGAG
jgi:hypothetical protein